MRKVSHHPLTRAATAAAALAVAGCATPPAAAPTSARAVASAAAAASAPDNAASAPDADGLKPFAVVSKGAQRQDGYIPVWRKDDKVWLEIGPDRLDKPLLFTVNVAQSVGERGLYASQMGPSWMVEFHRIGKQMQVVAKQLDFRAPGDPASRRAVGQGFSDSVVASGPVSSAEDPARKAVLVDASFLLADIAGYSTALEMAYRMPYAPDKANSYFERVRADAGMTTLEAKVLYAVPRIAAPPLLPPGAPRPMTPPPSENLPDPRSLFVGYVYSLRELPPQPMTPRAADPRVGYFTESYTDLSNDFRANPRVHQIRRWRLEKKDPQAALSEPVQPITYWLDANIPARYRASIRAGILEWNKAFEKIGYKDAIVVRQQADGDDFDDMDAQHASIRWFVGADVGFAIGPNRDDPRTGEILDADIGMSDVFGRGARRLIRDDVPRLPAIVGRHADEACDYAAEAAEQFDFALDLLEARGELDPDSPEAEAFVQNYIKDVITHEVGHTLGLRHNFKASTTVTLAELKDKAWAESHGISGSVMDYNAFNLPLAGEAKSEYNMVTLGAYDYWAIEYGYKPLTPGHEKAELEAIAERSRNDPRLAFADDGDAGGFGGITGLDPLVNRFDLGNDPLGWYERRLQLTRELWQRVEQRRPQAGDDPERARRSVLEGLRQLRNMPELAAKYVGGMNTSRDLPGSGKPAYVPVDPAQQRRALRFLTSGIFGADSFRFSPEFLASVGPDYVEWKRNGPLDVGAAVLKLQTTAMDKLLDAGTAQRLLDLPNFLPAAQRKGAIGLAEVYATLREAVWSELKSGKDIDPLRRDLQRAHLRRLQAVLTKPAPDLPADAISLTRMNAVELQGELRRAAGRSGLSVETRAHLQDALELITEALKATLQRS
ncbi:MAG: zinc-dependent metalloprotease [Burkholderiales bacterium]|nr:zinc-dependent metalloprotease [Burkholderiales bacterium]